MLSGNSVHTFMKKINTGTVGTKRYILFTNCMDMHTYITDISVTGRLKTVGALSKFDNF